MGERIQSQLEAAAALADPLRRELYGYVCSVGREVGRDEAAEAVGVGRDRVGSQLDRLAEAGLLQISFRRLSGRSGPGAGRPSKLYRPAALQIEVSVPPRRYGFAADLFAGALRAAGVPQATVDASAWASGNRLGHSLKGGAGGRPSRKRTIASLQAVAEDHGFRPLLSTRRMTLTNCPFRSLVDSRGELVCSMNLSLFRGIVAGLGADGMEASRIPDPQAGACCVTVRLQPSPVKPSQT